MNLKEANITTQILYHSRPYLVNELLDKDIETDLWSEHFRKTVDFLRLWFDQSDTIQQRTSGSTGQPKIIHISKKKMVTSAQSTMATLGLKTGNSALLNLNTDYIGGKMMVVRAIVNRSQLHIGALSSNPLSSLAVQAPIDFFSFVPLQLECIIKQTPEKLMLLNKAQAIILGGAPVTPQLTQLIK